MPDAVAALTAGDVVEVWRHDAVVWQMRAGGAEILPFRQSTRAVERRRAEAYVRSVLLLLAGAVLYLFNRPRRQD